MTTMILALLLAAQATEPPAPPPPLTQWPVLAPLPWRSPPVLAPGMTSFVAGEVKEGRCPVARPGRVALDLVVQVERPGRIRQVVPQAIGCPTVEQYAAGLVTGFARNNLRGASPGWYRVAVTFTLLG